MHSQMCLNSQICLNSQMCLNGTAVKVLASFLWCPHCDVVQIWPGRSLDTSAGLFPSMSAGEEFECEASIVLSISNNWWTIGERIHYTKTSSLINLTERERFHLLCSANYGYEAHSSCWDSSVRIQKLIRKDSNSSARIHLNTDFLWDFSERIDESSHIFIYQMMECHLPSRKWHLRGEATSKRSVA